MSIKIGDLRQKEVRTVISVVLDNKQHKVTIKNALGENREKLLKIFEEKSKEGTREASIELTKIILTELTDLEIGDEDIEDIISSPVAELSLIIHEVNEIMQEIQVQHWTGYIRQLNQSAVHLLTTQALQKVNQMSMLTKELESAKESSVELEKMLDKEILNLPIVQKKKSKNGKDIQ